MHFFKFKNSKKKLITLGASLSFFLVGVLLDFKLASLTIYPIYLISILYASINFSFISSVPFSVVAAYLSIHDEGLGSAGFINTLMVRFLLLTTISYLFSAYIGLVNTYRQRFELLKTLVPQCPDCGSILCNDGEWRSLEVISGKPELLGFLPRHECEPKSVSTLINKS